MSNNLYTYGIIENEDLELTVDGVAGAERIYTVDYRTLSAIVSDIDTIEPERTDEDVKTHNDVLGHVLEFDGGRTVVPMSFGMTFKNARTVKGILRGARGVLRKTLNEIDGRLELGVKLVAPEAVSLDRETIQTRFTERLSELSVTETENDVFSDRLLLNKSYLVEQDRREAFDLAVEELTNEVDDELLVQYTGPWAPYNFVDIHIGTQQEA